MYNRKNFGGEATYSAPSERDATNEGIESNERLKRERAKWRGEGGKKDTAKDGERRGSTTAFAGKRRGRRSLPTEVFRVYRRAPN